MSDKIMLTREQYEAAFPSGDGFDVIKDRLGVVPHVVD